jgi:hypothetical protein
MARDGRNRQGSRFRAELASAYKRGGHHAIAWIEVSAGGPAAELYRWAAEIRHPLSFTGLEISFS